MLIAVSAARVTMIRARPRILGLEDRDIAAKRLSRSSVTRVSIRPGAENLGVCVRSGEAVRHNCTNAQGETGALRHATFWLPRRGQYQGMWALRRLHIRAGIARL